MHEQPDRGDDSNDSSESGRAPSIDESSTDDGGLSMGEDSGMDSMAGSVNPVSRAQHGPSRPRFFL